MECQHKGFVEEHGSGGFTKTPSLVGFFFGGGGRLLGGSSHLVSD